MSKKDKNIEVAVRMRPLLDIYQDHQAWIANSKSKTISSIPKKSLMNITNLSTISNQDSSLYLKKRPSTSKVLQKNNVYEFSYDYVFSQDQKNMQVYQQACQKTIQQFLQGKHASIFMYGQTTSGKTHTMLGSHQQQGLINFSLKDIFNKSQKLSKNNQFIYISYMQIYNEQINDLLEPEGLNLRIVDDNVQGLSQSEIFSAKEAIQLLNQGEKLRSYAERNFHDHSSRSHTIFQIKLVKKDQKTGKIMSKNVLNLIDLAGSQRVGEQDSNQQTGYINKSLFVLSNVIHKLSQKKSGHVPFRDSKLTRVLSSSLTTSSHTIFICTISPAQINFAQTLSTLRFANQSRKVQLKCVEDTLILNQSSFMIQQKQINKLKEENISLKMNLEKNSYQKVSKKSFVQTTYEKLQAFVGHYFISNKENNSINTRKFKYSQINYSNSKKKMDQNKTISKLQCLYSEYQKNIENLERQYVKAMINLASNDLLIDKQELSQKIFK